MPFTPDPPFPKTRGHSIKSKDWNDAIIEIQRLDAVKVNKSGDSITGPLTISGNVGVGLSSPQRALSVNAALNVDQANANNGSVNPGITFGSLSGEGIASKRTAGGNQFGLDLYTGSTVRLNITSGGNVGIGIPTPATKLHVHLGRMRVSESDGAQTSGVLELSNAQATNYVFTDGATGHLHVRTDSANRHVLLQTAGAQGNVGIGTAQPQGRLDVGGDIRAGNSDIYFTRTDHNHTGIGNTAGYAAIENTADYGALMILGRAGTSRGRYVRLWDYLQVIGGMDVTGPVGVGTAGPQVKLHAVGNRIRIDNGGGNTLDLRADGGALDLESNGADLYINNNNIPVRIRNQQSVSSRDLKENIADFTPQEATETLEELNPVSFTWKDDEKKTRHIGFIAEDVPGIARSADRKAIIPIHILAILSQVVREQQRTISAMRRQLDLHETT